MENVLTGENVSFRKLIENNLFVEFDNDLRIDCCNNTATVFNYSFGEWEQILFRDCEVIKNEKKFTIIAPNQKELIFVLGEFCDCWQCHEIFTVPLKPIELKD